MHIKSDKSDPVYDFTSDCIKKAPDVLFSHMISSKASLFKAMSIVSLILLLATLVPITTDKLGNICSSP